MASSVPCNGTVKGVVLSVLVDGPADVTFAGRHVEEPLEGSPDHRPTGPLGMCREHSNGSLTHCRRYPGREGQRCPGLLPTASHPAFHRLERRSTPDRRLCAVRQIGVTG